MVWYSAMIAQDEEDRIELFRAVAEYNASFANPREVDKVRREREQNKIHTFADDEEFEAQLLDREYKENKYIKAIQKINDINKDANKRARYRDGLFSRTKLPIDLDDL